MPCPVVHFEIIGHDSEQSQSFYKRVFGWKINADNPMKYGSVDAEPGGIRGGIAAAMGGGGPRVTVYVQVAAIDACLAQIVESGGKVLLPRSAVPGGPTIALFSDPAGNIVGLMEPAQAR